MFFKTLRKCKFGDYCRYSHATSDNVNDMKSIKVSLEEMNNIYVALENHVKQLEIEIIFVIPSTVANSKFYYIL